MTHPPRLVMLGLFLGAELEGQVQRAERYRACQDEDNTQRKQDEAQNSRNKTSVVEIEKDNRYYNTNNAIDGSHICFHLIFSLFFVFTLLMQLMLQRYTNKLHASQVG